MPKWRGRWRDANGCPEARRDTDSAEAQREPVGHREGDERRRWGHQCVAKSMVPSAEAATATNFFKATNRAPKGVSRKEAEGRNYRGTHGDECPQTSVSPSSFKLHANCRDPPYTATLSWVSALP